MAFAYSYTNGCDGAGADCTYSGCPTAFHNREQENHGASNAGCRRIPTDPADGGARPPPSPDALPPKRTVDTDILDELHQGLLHPKRIVRLEVRISSALQESRSHPPRSLRKRRWWGTLVGSLTVVTSAFMGVKRAVATEVYVPLPLSLSLHHT